MREKLRKFRQGWQTLGVEYLLANIESRLPQWLFTYRHCHILKAERLSIPTREYKDYEFRFATPDDAPLMEPTDMPVDEFKRRIGGNYTFVLALRDNRVVSYSCVAFGRVFLNWFGAIFDTGEHGFLLSNVFTTPEERLKGLFTRCFKVQFEHYESLDRYVSYSEIDAINLNSMKVHRRLGFSPAGQSYHLILLGLNITWYRHWPHPTRRWHFFFHRPPENLPRA